MTEAVDKALPRSATAQYAAALVAMAACYFLAAYASLTLAIAPGYASAVWVPSGMALAALLYWGIRLWPGIWVGACAANLAIDGSLPIAAVIATGSTLEGACAAWLLHRVINPSVRNGFARPESVFLFVGVVGIGGLISATPAVLALLAAGFVAPDGVCANWYTWWLGDVVGMVVLTPFLLAWRRGMAGKAPGSPAELAVFVLLLAPTLAVVFNWAGQQVHDSARSLTFLLFPFSVWAGSRFGERAVTTATVTLAATAIWYTARNEGLFVLDSRDHSLLVLQAFTGVFALLGLVVCASSRARTEAVAQLRAAHDRLDGVVRERTAELERKNQSLARDVIEKEELAHSLQEREAQLAEAQAITHIGSWTWDVASNRVTWSDELYRIYGLSPASFGASFEAYLACVHPEDRPRVTAVVQAALERQEPWEVRERIVRPDGSVRVLRSLGKVVTDTAGRTIGLHGVCLDDTQRARLEQIQAVHLDVTKALVQARSWRDAVATALQLLCQRLGWALGQMWRVDAQGSVLHHEVGAWAEPQLTLALARFIEDSRTFAFASGQGLPGRVWAQQRALWSEDVQQDANFPRRAAAERAGLHAGFALPLTAGGKVLGVLEFFHQEVRKPDHEMLQMLGALGSQLGEYFVRSESEALLRLAEERFRLLIESVEDYAIFMLDPDGIVSTWNAGAQRIKGYSAQEIVGAHFSRFHVAEDVAAGLPARALSGAAAEGRFETEGWRLRKDGSRFWVHGVLTALRDADGQLAGFSQITRDLTERKRMEALEETVRHIQQFLAMLAHELRNPLAPLRTAVAVMHLRQMADPDLSKCRDIIGRQVDHLARLVDDLLDASRITRGRIEVRREPVDLADVVHRALEASRPLIELKRHQLQVSLPPVPAMVNGDGIRLAQLLQNLLNNAAKFTPSGGHIGVTLTSENGTAIVEVRDSGAGLAADLLPKVFDLFVQGKQGLDRSEGGLGIGLALVREIAHLHGGSVQADSPGPGQGATFTLRLPLLLEHPASRLVRDAGSAGPDGSMSSRPRVLVVDDNRDAADSLCDLLQMWGHDCWSAYDGPSALGLAEAHAPDAVLLDIGLPGMDGYEVAARLRERPAHHQSILIALTGYGQPEDRQRTRTAGFSHHLLKPVDPGILRDLLATIRAR